VVKVFDKAQIIARGITQTSAGVVDGELKIAGKVPEVDEIVKVLSR